MLTTLIHHNTFVHSIVHYKFMLNFLYGLSGECCLLHAYIFVQLCNTAPTYSAEEDGPQMSSGGQDSIEEATCDFYQQPEFSISSRYFMFCSITQAVERLPFRRRKLFNQHVQTEIACHLSVMPRTPYVCMVQFTEFSGQILERIKYMFCI